MAQLLYFPGCSLKQEARDFESSGLAMMEALGFPLVELERWNCCGTVFSLTQDDLMHQIGPIRNLIRVQEAGESELVTLCSMCFNTLKRSQIFIKEQADRVDKINAFMDDEQDYLGEVQIRHLLEILRDRVGWDQIAKQIQQPLQGYRIASYYGCTLLRPSDVAIDGVERPTVLQELVNVVGAEVTSFGFETECCGSYQVTDQRSIVMEQAYRILSAAHKAGADMIITSCPLCHYNLSYLQTEINAAVSEFKPLPVFYFTQILAYALGLEIDKSFLGELQAIEKQSLELAR